MSAAAEAADEAQRMVDAAYALHDERFQPGEDAVHAQRMVDAQAAALAAVVKAEAAAAPDVTARLFYLRGKAIASTEEGRSSMEAEYRLADAIKLDPSLVDAWNCLGECYWERGELDMARHTFQAALEHERSAQTLCHLSMLLRTMSQRDGGVDALLLQSVALSKESVRIDTASERSWAGLGAAHLMLHVHVSSEAEDLHLAHCAFKQASKVAEKQDASHIANHATVLTMLDCPDEALRLFTIAHELDPSVGALQKRADAWAAVSRCAEAVAHFRGAKGAKRLAAVLADLASSPLPPGTPPPTPLSQLTLGENKGKSVRVKVLINVPYAGGGPLSSLRSAAAHQTLVVADAAERLMGLSLYAVRGVPPLEAGTTLDISEPFLLRVEASPFWLQGSATGAATGSATESATGAATGAAAGAAEQPAAGFHLMRVEQPTTQLRIDGQVVRPHSGRRLSGP